MVLAWKVPSPLPSSTLTVLVALVGGDEVGLAVAVEIRHRHRVRRYVPVGSGLRQLEVPSPLPSSTLTVLLPSSWR